MTLRHDFSSALADKHYAEPEHVKAALRELAKHLGRCAAKRDWQAFIDEQSAIDNNTNQGGLND